MVLGSGWAEAGAIALAATHCAHGVFLLPAVTTAYLPTYCAYRAHGVAAFLAADDADLHRLWEDVRRWVERGGVQRCCGGRVSCWVRERC